MIIEIQIRRRNQTPFFSTSKWGKKVESSSDSMTKWLKGLLKTIFVINVCSLFFFFYSRVFLGHERKMTDDGRGAKELHSKELI